jgi:hypothetical protein
LCTCFRRTTTSSIPTARRLSIFPVT